MVVYISSAVVLKIHKCLFICFVLLAEQAAIIPCTAMTDWSLQWECECYCDARTEILDIRQKHSVHHRVQNKYLLCGCNCA